MLRGPTLSWAHCAGSRGETVLKSVGEANGVLVEKLVGPMAPLVGRRFGYRHVQWLRPLGCKLSRAARRSSVASPRGRPGPLRGFLV
jgi:hypothetical protein